jgi:hypothetical protein
MKKLIILIISSVFILSCTKETDTVQFQKNNILLNDNLSTSKIKQKVNSVTVTAEFDSKTGQVSLKSDNKKQPVTFVRYQSYKGPSLTLNSSIGFGKYIGPFVVSNYSAITSKTNYLINLQVKTSNGTNYEFLFEGVR